MEIKEKISECVAKVLNISNESILKLAGDEPLRVMGVDSINCVDIVIAIEQEFNIVFIDEDLLFENLNSMNKICEIVKKKLQQICTI